MELVNDTPFCARLLRLPRGGDQFQAALVVKSTFELHSNGRLIPAGAQLPILDEALTTEFGVLHRDCFLPAGPAHELTAQIRTVHLEPDHDRVSLVFVGEHQEPGFVRPGKREHIRCAVKWS